MARATRGLQNLPHKFIMNQDVIVALRIVGGVTGGLVGLAICLAALDHYFKQKRERLLWLRASYHPESLTAIKNKLICLYNWHKLNSDAKIIEGELFLEAQELGVLLQKYGGPLLQEKAVRRYQDAISDKLFCPTKSGPIFNMEQAKETGCFHNPVPGGKFRDPVFDLQPAWNPNTRCYENTRVPADFAFVHILNDLAQAIVDYEKTCKA